MAGKKRTVLLLILCLICISSVFVSCKSGGEKAGPAISESSAEKEKIREIIKNAVENAKKNGETSVDIFLNEIAGTVQPGDLVELDLTVSLEDGTMIRTTVAEKAEKLKHSGRKNQEGVSSLNGLFVPEPVIVSDTGGKDMISKAVTGKYVGASGQVVVSPDGGGVPYKKENVKKFSRIKRMNAKETLTIREFEKQFGKAPISGMRIPRNPYFRAIVTDVENNKVVLSPDVKDGMVFRDDIGTTSVTVDENYVTLLLNPKKGARFEAGEKNGRIIRITESDFFVDFNRPEAGKNLVIDYTIQGLEKASGVHSAKIEWEDNPDIDSMMEEIPENNRPSFLFLYAEWCPWCKKMKEKVFSDPRVRVLADEIDWIRVDSAKQPEYKEIFEQKTYPTMILMNRDHSVYRTLSGYRDPSKLHKEIRLWMEDLAKGRFEYKGDAMNDGSSSSSKSCGA